MRRARIATRARGVAATGGVVLVLAAGSAALAQSQRSVERFDRQLEQLQRQQTLEVNRDFPVGRRVLADVGGYYSFNYLSLDDELDDNHVLRQHDLIGYGRVNVDGVHEFFTRGRLSWQDFNPGDSFDGEGDNFEPTLERAFYRFDYQRARAAYGGEEVDGNLVVQVGRQLVYWGNGLVLSQALDGAVVGVSHGPLSLLVFGGMTPKRTVDFDSSRPDFDDDTHRFFYGGMVTAAVGEHRPFVYVLAQDDQNHDDTLAVSGTTTRFKYDSYYVGIGSSGTLSDRLNYGVELAYEGGQSLSNSFELAGNGAPTPVDQTRDPIHAFGADVRLDYLFPDVRRTRAGAEVIFATGDNDRLNSTNTFGGNEPGSSDRAFNAFGLVNTGLAFAPSVSNLIVTRVGVSTFPIPDSSTFRSLQVGLDVFTFCKADREAPIDEPTDVGRYLGVEPNVFLNWQIRSDVTLAVRYGAFFPNAATMASDEVRQFVFGGVTFAF